MAKTHERFFFTNGGKGRIEQLMMEIFAVMLREGVM